MSYALITGASGGLGYEFAKILAQNKYNLVLVARNKERLQEIQKELGEKYSIEIKIITSDLSSISDMKKLYEKTKMDTLTIEVLVNNAGFGTYGNFQEIDLQQQIDEINVNVTALTTLTQLFLPGMLEHKSGKVLNVASMAAFLPGPLMAVYYATKAYVLSFSQAVNYELKGTGVSITTLCPGPTKTGFEKSANMNNSKLFKSHVMDAHIVAQAGVNGLMQGKDVVIPGIRNWIYATCAKYIPHNIAMKIVLQTQGKLA